ncbi:hypothetical protein GQ457_15G000650 [Hibiscus cannabinus]
MVESSVVAGQVIARDLDSSLASRVGVAGEFDLSQFPSLEESLKICKDEIGGGAMGSSSKSIDWNLFDQSLKFFPPVEKDGQLLVQPPRSVLDDGTKQWSNALIGTFLGKSSILSVFQRTANRLWGREGLPASILVDLGAGDIVSVGVKLVWAPPKCCHRSIFGHSDEKCSRRIVVGSVLTSDESTQVLVQDKLSDVVVPLVGFVLGEVVVNDVAVSKQQFVGSALDNGVLCEDVNLVLQQPVNGTVMCDDVATGGDIAPISVKGGDFLEGTEVIFVDSAEGVVANSDSSGVVLSPNRFEALCNAAVEHEPIASPRKDRVAAVGVEYEPIASPRKGRMAAAGVVELLNQLKPKGRDGGQKQNKKQGKGGKRRDEKVGLWDELNVFKGTVGASLWAIFGDFNVMNCPQESSDYDGSQGVTGAMQDFLDCQESIDVVDHPFLGALFTWCNQREEAPLLRKLDRFIVNQAWLDSFPVATVEFLLSDCSDHSPSNLVLSAPLLKPPRPFKFFNFWVDHPEFLRTVELSWSESVLGNPLQVLFAKLKRLKLPLKRFNKEYFGEISQRVLAKQIELENIQKLLLSNPSGELIAREKELQQKANSVCSLYSRQGAKLDTFEAISNEFIQFFTDSLGTIDDHVVQFSDDLLKQILGVELSAEIQDSLVPPITHKEIKDVLFSMNGNKALGPDGFTAKFFQAAWSVVGLDFLRVVQFFFATSSLSDAFNATIITLVPKVANPTQASNFRPISCCNIVYKCITKLMANQMKNGCPLLFCLVKVLFLLGGT